MPHDTVSLVLPEHGCPPFFGAFRIMRLRKTWPVSALHALQSVHMDNMQSVTSRLHSYSVCRLDSDFGPMHGCPHLFLAVATLLSRNWSPVQCSSGLYQAPQVLN